MLELFKASYGDLITQLFLLGFHFYFYFISFFGQLVLCSSCNLYFISILCTCCVKQLLPIVSVKHPQAKLFTPGELWGRSNRQTLRVEFLRKCQTVQIKIVLWETLEGLQTCSTSSCGCWAAGFQEDCKGVDFHGCFGEGEEIQIGNVKCHKADCYNWYLAIF